MRPHSRHVKLFNRTLKFFHSYRYVGDKLVMRLMAPLAADEPARLQEEFADLIKAGGITRRGALEEEADEPEMAALLRLMFRPHRRDFGRLRQLIDAINRARVAGVAKE